MASRLMRSRGMQTIPAAPNEQPAAGMVCVPRVCMSLLAMDRHSSIGAEDKGVGCGK